MIYTIAIEKGDNTHAHGISFPDVKGCFSASDDFNDIFDNARQALLLHIEGMVEDGEDIPKPRPFEDYINNPEYDDYILNVVEVDLTHLLGKSEKINVTLPSLLIKKIDDFVSVHPEYKNRSNFLAKVSLDKLLN